MYGERSWERFVSLLRPIITQKSHSIPQIVSSADPRLTTLTLHSEQLQKSRGEGRSGSVRVAAAKLTTERRFVHVMVLAGAMPSNDCLICLQADCLHKVSAKDAVDGASAPTQKNRLFRKAAGIVALAKPSKPSPNISDIGDRQNNGVLSPDINIGVDAEEDFKVDIEERRWC